MAMTLQYVTNKGKHKQVELVRAGHNNTYVIRWQSGEIGVVARARCSEISDNGIQKKSESVIPAKKVSNTPAATKHADGTVSIDLTGLKASKALSELYRITSSLSEYGTVEDTGHGVSITGFSGGKVEILVLPEHLTDSTEKTPSFLKLHGVDGRSKLGKLLKEYPAGHGACGAESYVLEQYFSQGNEGIDYGAL